MSTALQQGVDVHPLQEQVDVDLLHHAIEIDALQQLLEIDSVHEGLDVDLVDECVHVQAVDDGVDVHPVHDCLDIDALDDLIHVEGADHPRSDLVRHRLNDLARATEQRIDQSVAFAPRPIRHAWVRGHDGSQPGSCGVDTSRRPGLPAFAPVDVGTLGAIPPEAFTVVDTKLANASFRHSTSRSGSIDDRRVERDAEVEAIFVSERRDVHRTSQTRPHGVAALDPRATDVPCSPQPRERRGGEIDGLGLGVQRRDQQPVGKAPDRRRELGRNLQRRLTSSLRKSFGNHAELWSGAPEGGRDLDARRREPVATGSVAVALAGRCEDAKLRACLPDPLVVEPDARRRRRHQEVVAAAAESAQGRSGSFDGQHFDPVEHRLAGRTRREWPAGHQQLTRHGVGDIEGALDTPNNRVDGVDVPRGVGAVEDSAGPRSEGRR